MCGEIPAERGQVLCRVFARWCQQTPVAGEDERQWISTLEALDRLPATANWMWVTEQPLGPELPRIHQWLVDNPTGRGTIIGGDGLQGCGYRYSQDRLSIGAWSDWPILVDCAPGGVIRGWQEVSTWASATEKATATVLATLPDWPRVLLMSRDYPLRAAAEDAGHRSAGVNPPEFPPISPDAIIIDLEDDTDSGQTLTNLLPRLKIAYRSATILAAESFPRWSEAAERLEGGVVTFERIHLWRFLSKRR